MTDLLHEIHIAPSILSADFSRLGHDVEAVLNAGAVHERLQRRDDQRADGDVRYEVAVHDVDMDHPRAGVEHRLHVVAQTREVCRQDGRGDVDLVQQVRHVLLHVRVGAGGPARRPA
jgi:hypothetical protein